MFSQKYFSRCNLRDLLDLYVDLSHLVSDLGWQSLTQRRNNARLHLFCKGIHGLAAVPVDTFRRPIRTSRYSDGDTFITLSSHVDSYK